MGGRWMVEIGILSIASRVETMVETQKVCWYLRWGIESGPRVTFRSCEMDFLHPQVGGRAARRGVP